MEVHCISGLPWRSSLGGTETQEIVDAFVDLRLMVGRQFYFGCWSSRCPPLRAWRSAEGHGLRSFWLCCPFCR